MNSMARRMFELVEPIGVIPYSADEPNDAMFALGDTARFLEPAPHSAPASVGRVRPAG